MIDAIFIVGTGRSGTHFLCRTLRGFQNIDDFRNGKENLDVLYKITNLALEHKPLTKDIIKYYKTQIKQAKSQNKIFLDQHHPNLYHVEQLIEHFPNALFLATDRPIEQIVASMLNHRGVRSWVENANNKNYVYPNQFLGIDSKAELTDDSYILCAKRVKAHNIQREKLLEKFPSKVKKIEFVKLVEGQYEYFQKIFSSKTMKRFGSYTEKEKSNKQTLEKYKSVISEKELTNIIS